MSILCRTARPPAPPARPACPAPPTPQVLAPEVKPGIWFHDLPALATLRGTVAAVDAGTTQAGMAMARVARADPPPTEATWPQE